MNDDNTNDADTVYAEDLQAWYDEDSPFDGDPVPLSVDVSIPVFPVDALPGPVAEMVSAVAEATQTDPAMPGTSALSVLSTCTGGRAEIEIRSGWREPLNLYTATIAAPGERKSAVQQLMTTPLYLVERQLAERIEGSRLEAETRKLIAQKAADTSQREAAKLAGTSDANEAMSNAISAAIRADEIQVPVIPRLFADDITPEAGASLLAEQGGRLAIISAEGGIFDIIAGRYSGNIPNLDLWLKGHSGDPVRVDRKNRQTEYIAKPALTLGLMIQPTVLNEIASNRQFRGRGLLARILYAYPQSRVGFRNVDPPPPEPATINGYETAVSMLALGLVDRVNDPAVLTLTATGYKAMLSIQEAVVPTLAGEGALASLAEWGAKYAGAVARIAGILHLAELGADVGSRSEVTAQTIRNAWRLGNFYKTCAVKAFTEMGADRVIADAQYLLDRITALGSETISERDMHAACSRSRFKIKADLKPALDRLVDHGYLAALPIVKKTERGRPPSPRFQVHPLLTQNTKSQK